MSWDTLPIWKFSLGPFWAVRAAEKKNPNCHKYATFEASFLMFSLNCWSSLCWLLLWFTLIDLFQKCCWESDIKLIKTTCSSSRVQKRVVLLVIWLFFCVYDLLSWLSLTRQMAIPAITKAISVVCIVLWAPLVYRPVGRYENPEGGN